MVVVFLIGERIREYRKKSGLTQKALGSLCGIAEPTIRKYELGLLNPKIETIRKIANALKISEFDLMADMKDLSSDVALLDRISITFGSGSAELLHNYSLLNDEGKEKAFDYIADLTGLDRYLKKE